METSRLLGFIVVIDIHIGIMEKTMETAILLGFIGVI